MTGIERDEAWLAYRIARLSEDSKKRKSLIKTASKRALAMAEIMPALLDGNCLAEAQRLAVEAAA